jgi:AcrR family transcriptional regulator
VPRAVREREMLEVARAAFGKRGFHGASMEQIAKGAGVTKPMLYAYFGSKEGLFAACVRLDAEALRERIRSVVAVARRPDEAFYQGLLAVFDFVEENPGGWTVVYPARGAPTGPIGEQGARATEGMVELLEGLFRRVGMGQGVGDEALSHARPMAQAVTAATIAAASAWVRDPTEPKELAALRLMNFAWMGLGDMLQGRLWLPGEAG